MPDGRWLNVAVPPPPVVPPWGWPFLLSFLLSVFGVAVVAVLTGRRISNPMRSLAAAADRFGRGGEVGDLPEAGPREIRSTVRAFNLMRGRLDRYVRDRTAMLAAISHDLRTPIASLRLQAEFVEHGESRRKILAALDEMQRIAEDTLAFIREDTRREGTRTVDLHALIDSVAADLADLGHELAVPDSGRVLVACRPVALRRAFRNLLDIPEADLERVFEPFVRLDESRSSETGGAGLGLAIARTIVHGHGGNIRLENRRRRRIEGDGHAARRRWHLRLLGPARNLGPACAVRRNPAGGFGLKGMLPGTDGTAWRGRIANWAEEVVLNARGVVVVENGCLTAGDTALLLGLRRRKRRIRQSRSTLPILPTFCKIFAILDLRR